MSNDYYILRNGNIIVSRAFKKGPRHGFSLYEIYPEHTEFWTAEQFEQDLIRNEVVMSKLRYQGMFLKVPVEPDPEPRLRVDDSQVPESFKSAHEISIQRSKRYIQETPFEYRMYLVLGLRELAGNPLIDLYQAIWESWWDPVRRMEHRLGLQPYTLADSQWARFQQDEEAVYELLSSQLSIRRLEPGEVDALLKRVGRRGINPARFQTEDPELIHHNGLITGSPDECLPSFDDIEIDPSDESVLRYEEATPEGIREGFISHLVIHRLPKGLSQYPGGTALFKILPELFDFPLEMSLSFEPIDWKVAKFHSGISRWFSKKAGSSRAAKGKNFDQYQKAYDDSDQLMAELEEEERPMFKTQFIITVWGESKEEVIRRRKLIKEKLDKYSVIIPKKKQKDLYYSSLPAMPRKFGSNYSLKMTTEWLAATQPFGGINLGDRQGYLIGFTSFGLPKPVYHDFRRPNRKGRTVSAPHVLLYGASGSGKSTVGNYMVVTEVQRGAKGLIFDPKNERTYWMFEIPWLQDHIEVVTLQEDENDRGKLDPLLRVFHPDLHRGAIASAKRIMWHLASQDPDTYGGKAISYAIDLVVDRYFREKRKEWRPCMINVIKVIEEYLGGEEIFSQGKYDFIREDAEKEVRTAFSNLIYNSRTGLGKLLFGRGNEKAVDFTAPLTILQVQNLNAASKEDPDYRLHSALFMAITDICRDFVTEQGNRVVMLDELYKFTAKDHKMREEIRILLRQGRSQRNKVILSTHNERDLVLDEDVEDGAGEVRSNLGTKYIYRVDDYEEAKRALEMLGLKPTKDNLKLITSREQMISGRFLMQDYDGNPGLVDFPLERIDPVLFQAFRTDNEIMDWRWEQYRDQLGQAQREAIEIQRKLDQQRREEVVV